MTVPKVLPPTRAHRACPACEAHAPAHKVGEKSCYEWLACNACGTFFVPHFPSTEELDRVYNSYYHAGNLSVPDFVLRRHEEVLTPFSAYRQTGRLLDVGYGAGTLLAVAERLGWECWGQEISPQPLLVGRERGWHVLEGDLREVEVPPDHFDVVCITGVLEHVERPLEYLRRALAALRPGGLLYATTPNGLSMTGRLLGMAWSVIAPPEHVQLFTPASLAEACRRAGFVQRGVRCEGLNPYEIKGKWGKPLAPVDRVRTGYALNERLSSGLLPRLVKATANEVLSLTRLGDELKYSGEKPRSSEARAPAPEGTRRRLTSQRSSW